MREVVVMMHFLIPDGEPLSQSAQDAVRNSIEQAGESMRGLVRAAYGMHFSPAVALAFDDERDLTPDMWSDEEIRETKAVHASQKTLRLVTP